MEVLVGIVIKVPEHCDIALQRRLIDLKEIGVKKTKAQLASEMVQIGLLHSKIETT